ncbi:MAG: site-2 protease family protein [Bacillota bacterium]|nr:site-2 protease family protein [Candidatus Fermentithermobacillaceae bacterium]
MPDSLVVLILRLPGLLLAISVHEYAHARMAYRLGDDTAELSGRMSLEPWAHFDIVGALMLLLVGFGWAKPVPVDPYRLRDPRRDMAKIAFAGPMANLITAFVLEVVSILLRATYRFSGVWVYLPLVLQLAATINAGLAIFNLIPIPPLDGSRIVEQFIPYRYRHVWDEIQRYGFIILVALLVLGVVSRIMMPLVTALIGLADGVAWTLLMLFSRL